MINIDPFLVKITPRLRLQLEDTMCWCMDWANSDLIIVGCTNGMESMVYLQNINCLNRLCRHLSCATSFLQLYLKRYAHHIIFHSINLPYGLYLGPRYPQWPLLVNGKMIVIYVLNSFSLILILFVIRCHQQYCVFPLCRRSPRPG